MITVAAFGIEPAALRERFEKCRFAATVLPDKEGDLAAECQIDAVREGADIERILGWIDLLVEAGDSVEERCVRDLHRPGHPPSRLHPSTMPRGAPAMPDGHGLGRGAHAKAAVPPAPTRVSQRFRILG